MICDELNAHIEDQTLAYEEAGEPRGTAEQRAVKEMGDPVLVGEQLDRTHRPRPAWSVVFFAALISAAAGVVQWELAGTAGAWGMEHWLISVAAGAVLIVAVYFVDFTILGLHPFLCYLILTVAGTVLLGLFYAGQDSSFTDIFKIRMGQYLISMLSAPVIAGLVHHYRGKGMGGILMCSLFLLIGCILSLAAPCALGALLLGVSGVIVLTAAILRGHFGPQKKRQLITFWSAGLAGFALFLLMVWRSSGYRFMRMISVLFAVAVKEDELGAGFMTNYLRRSLMSFRLFRGTAGTMLAETGGVSPDQLSHDYFLNYLSYQYGMWSSLLLIGILAGLVICMAGIVRKQKNTLGFLVSLSVASAVGCSGLFCVLSNMGFMNVSGTFPFVTPYESVYLTFAALLGLFLSACKGNHYLRDKDIDCEIGSSFLHKAAATVFPYRLRLSWVRADSGERLSGAVERVVGKASGKRGKTNENR